MTALSRRTLIASGLVLLVAIAAIAAIVTRAASPQSPPSGQGSASARTSAGGTSTPGASTSPAPGASTPSPSALSAPSPSATPSRTPTPAGSTVVRVSKPARVDVVTTFAGWNGLSHAVEVGGYAAVVEPVGTCTLRLSHGDTVVTRKHTASPDATTVACGGFSIPRSELSEGRWTAVLGYRSPTSAGEAPAISFTVP